MPQPRSQRGQKRGELALIEKALPPDPHPATPPPPPDGLGPAGLAVWAEAWGCAWAQQTDRPTIAHLATLEDRAADMAATIDREGLTLTEAIVSPKGEVVDHRTYSHPLLVQLAKAENMIVNLRGRLALDPVSRVRLGISAVDLQSRDSDLKRLQRRRTINRES